MNAKKLLTLQGAAFALITVLLWVSPEKIVWTFEFVESPNLAPYINFLSVLLLSLGMLSSILSNLPEEYLGDVCAAFGVTQLLFLIVKIHQLTTSDNAYNMGAVFSLTVTSIFILLFFNEYRKLK